MCLRKKKISPIEFPIRIPIEVIQRMEQMLTHDDAYFYYENKTVDPATISRAPSNHSDANIQKSHRASVS